MAHTTGTHYKDAEDGKCKECDEHFSSWAGYCANCWKIYCTSEEDKNAKRQHLKEQYLEASQAYKACRGVFLSFLQNESDEAWEYTRQHDIGDEGDVARTLQDRMRGLAEQIADDDSTQHPAAPSGSSSSYGKRKGGTEANADADCAGQS